MVGHKKVVLTLLLVTLLGAFFIPLQSVAVIANNDKQQNYRGTLAISAQTFDFLLGFPKGHIRFAMWDGKSWIELPFWIVHRPEYQTHIDMNNTGTGTTGHVVHSEQLSASDYFVLVIPNKKGLKVDINNWWSLARKSGFDRRAQLLIGEDPSTVNTPSGNSDSQGLLNTILFGDSTDNKISSVVYIYFGGRVTLSPQKYTLRDVYYSFDKAHEFTKNSTTTKKISPLKKTFTDLKMRFPINYKVISIGEIEKELISTFKASLLLDVMVMQRQISFKFFKFKDSGYTYKEGEYFFLPEIQYIDECQVRLEVKGIAPLGSYQRYLTIKLKNNKGTFYLKRNEKVSSYFRFDIDISQQAAYYDSGSANYLYIQLPTWSDGSSYPGEYWIVNATVHYLYYANRNNRLSVYTMDIAKPRYEFVHTGWQMIKFPLPLVENKIYDPDHSTVTFDLDFTSVSDSWTRVLKVYLITDYESALIYSGTVNPGTWHKHFTLSPDQVQDYLEPVTEAQIGIVLTTYVGYWKLTGQINMTYRPEVFPDTSNSWDEMYIPYRIRAGNTFVKTSDPGDYMNKLFGGYIYTVLYKRLGRRFKSELSTYLLTPYYYASTTNVAIQTTIKWDENGISEGDFVSVIKRQYDQGDQIDKNYSELVRAGSLALKVAAILAPTPISKVLLSLGSLGLSVIAGTSTSTTEATHSENPMTLYFYSHATPEYDSESGKYSIRNNFYIQFTDEHSTTKSLYYVSNVSYHIIVTQEIDVKISFSDSFEYTYIS